MTAASVQITTPETGADAPPAPAAPGSRPEWLPEKFYADGKPNFEALAKSYAELEKSKGVVTPPAVVPPVVAPPAAMTPEQANEAMTSKGLEVKALYAEFEKDGKLSQESYDKLAKAGWDKGFVDSYIAGQTARGNELAGEVFGIAGGEAEYRELMTWAGTSLPAEEIAQFNKLTDEGKLEDIKTTVRGLHARMIVARGHEPSGTIQGGTGLGGKSGAVPFANWEQVAKSAGSHEYKTDPAFRAAHQARLAVSAI